MKKTNKQDEPEKKEQEPVVTQVEKLQEELGLIKEELEEKTNAHLRALADYHNLEKRSEQLYAHAVKSAQARLLREVLNLKQDIERAQEFDKTGSWKLISQKFDTILSNVGVKDIDALNREFSPDTMECIEVVQGEKDNIVTKIHEKGYMLGDALLKPARVAVSKVQTEHETKTDNES